MARKQTKRSADARSAGLKSGLRAVLAWTDARPFARKLLHDGTSEEWGDEWFLAGVIADANRVFDRLMELDTVRAELALEGAATEEEERSIRGLLADWLHASRRLSDPVLCDRVPEDAVGAAAFFRNIREAEAMLSPSMALDGRMTELRDEAAAEHRDGRTVDLLEGLGR